MKQLKFKEKNLVNDDLIRLGRYVGHIKVCAPIFLQVTLVKVVRL